MASYLEIKKVLGIIFMLDKEIDEECDIIVPLDLFNGGNKELQFSNCILKEAFDKMQSYKRDKLVMTSSNYREVALQFFRYINRNATEAEQIEDYTNGIKYVIEPASLEYCMLLLDEIVESIKDDGRRMLIDLRHRTRRTLKMREYEEEDNGEILADILRGITLKIYSDRPVIETRLDSYAAAFEFQLMYKQGSAVSEFVDVKDMYFAGNTIPKASRDIVDSPPHRIYNSAVLDYYTMAMESRDPFTMYISFYHIIEHYFDAIFRKKLTEEMRTKITHPDFSYKSEEKLYELAKYVKKHMQSDNDSGKGDEFESLRYVLMEYVPIESLKKRISQLDPRAIDYYKESLVPFTTSTKTKIAWADSQGVYTNLANRIYETRNALVHSKSEQISNQYRPYENKKDLMLEIALIRATAEQVLINSSEIL